MSLPRLRMNSYRPNRWVIIRFKSDGEEVYKVMGGWSGGYLDVDSWRLNSGIVEVIDNGDEYEFVGTSGSVYICNKRTEGMTGLMGDVYHNWKNKIKEESKIEIVDAKEYYESSKTKNG